MKAKPCRISLWVPADKSWILQVIAEIRLEAEKEGISLSQADVILGALDSLWEKPEKETFSFSKKKRPKKVQRRRVVYARKKDDWVLSAIDRLVEVKKSSGMKSSFSYELFRLVKHSLLGTLEGKKLDLTILSGD